MSGTAFAGAPAVKKSAEEIAREVVGELQRGEFDAAERRFDEKMKGAIPVEKLRKIWSDLTAQSGALTRVAGAQVVPAGPYRKVFVDCEFARARWRLVIVLTADDRVTGLFITPPPQESAAAWTPPPYAARADAIEERAVTVGSLALPGVLTVPRGAGPFPAVVLVHGSGPQDVDETIGPNKPFKDLALGLAARGVASLRYEKRTHAHPELAVGRFTVEDETVADARAGLALVAGAARVDPKRLVIVGHSLGAILAPRIAAKSGAAAVVLMAGSPRAFVEIVLEQVNRLGDAALIAATEAAARRIRDPKLAPDDTVELLGAKIPGSYFLDLRAYHAGEAAAKLELPIFVAQGGHDIQIGGADFDAWKRALAGRPRVRFKLYPTLTHLFTPGDGNQADYARAGHVAPEVVDDLAAFVKEAR